MRSNYCVRVGFGRRNHRVAVPESGPCVPAYLSPDAVIRHVWISVDAEQSERAQEIEATLASHELAEALSYPSDTSEAKRPVSPLMVCGDMVTSLRVVDVIP